VAEKLEPHTSHPHTHTSKQSIQFFGFVQVINDVDRERKECVCERRGEEEAHDEVRRGGNFFPIQSVSTRHHILIPTHNSLKFLQTQYTLFEGSVVTVSSIDVFELKTVVVIAVA
jgi:hypothetical protein